MIVMYLVNKYI